MPQRAKGSEFDSRAEKRLPTTVRALTLLRLFPHRRAPGRRADAGEIAAALAIAAKNHLRTFRLFSSKTVAKFEFFETRAPQSTSKKSIRIKTGPREKRQGPGRGPGQAKLRGKVSLRERRCAKKCAPSVAGAPFCVGPRCPVRQMASRPRRHTAGCRRGCLPLRLHSQDRRADFTCYPQIVCAGERRRRRASGAPPDRAGGKKNGTARVKTCRSPVAFRRPGLVPAWPPGLTQIIHGPRASAEGA